MLQIIEIVSSEHIIESDLKHLEFEIERHTKFILSIQKDLFPIHHILLHYSRVVRTMGPAIFTSSMRLEAKHQELKATAQKTKNFINLNKTIAEKHQLSMFLTKNKYCDEIVPGKELMIFEETEYFENYKSLPLERNGIFIKSLKVNSSFFKSGLLLLHESKFFEITQILCSSDHSNYWFLCHNSFDIKKRDLFCNSLIVEENHLLFNVLNLNQIEKK